MFFLFQFDLIDGWTWQGVIGSVATFVISLSLLIGSIKTIRTDGWQAFKDKWITPFKTRRAQRAAREIQLDQVVTTCGSLGGRIDEILREVKPNGGTSLKDKVISIENKMDNIDARVRHQDETSANPIFHLDAEGKMTYTNCAFRELLNADEKQLQHHDYLSMMEDEDRARFVRSMDESIKYRMPLDAIVKFRLHGPHVVTVRLQASPDVRQGGELKCFFGTATEIKPEA